MWLDELGKLTKKSSDLIGNRTREIGLHPLCEYTMKISVPLNGMSVELEFCSTGDEGVKDID
jgi:hypothetical protein